MFLTKLSHPNIVRCMGYEKTSKEFRVFFEYCGCGSFWDIIHKRRARKNPFSEKELWHYASEVIAGLVYLHSKKSANILVDGDPDGLPNCEYYHTVKLCDFNISTSSQGALTKLGTPEYMPPELIIHRDNPNYIIDTEKADIWAYGMFMVELITLNYPYATVKQNEYPSYIVKGILPPDLPKDNKAVDLIKWCCKLEHKDRPRAKEIFSYLNPFAGKK